MVIILSSLHDHSSPQTILPLLHLLLCHEHLLLAVPLLPDLVNPEVHRHVVLVAGPC